MTWMYLSVTLVSGLAAILAWATKLRWSNEYRLAKDEIANALKAQIALLKTEVENLRASDSIRLRDRYLAIKSQLEEYNKSLERELKSAEDELQKRQKTIDALKQGTETGRGNLACLEGERTALAEAKAALERHLIPLDDQAGVPNLGLLVAAASPLRELRSRIWPEAKKESREWLEHLEKVMQAASSMSPERSSPRQESRVCEERQTMRRTPGD